MEQSVERKLAWETKILGENPSQCHSVHHKSNLTWDRTRAVAIGNKQGNLDRQYVINIKITVPPKLKN
jgi:hypothetical protein